MQNSSTSSSSPRRIVLFVLGLLAVFLVAEIGARILEPGFGHDGTWPSNETFVKHTQMSELNTPVDTVYIGSSLVAFGIDSQLISDQSGTTHYNAALSAGQVEMLSLWTQEFVVPMITPRRVVIGIGLTELNGTGQNNASLNVFTEAAAIQQLLDPTTLRNVESSVSDVSALFKYRRKLHDIRDIGRAAINGGFPDYWGSLGERQDDFSAERIVEDLQPSTATAEPSPERTLVLAELVASLEHQGIDVVLIAMPAAQPTLDAFADGGTELILALEEVAASSDATAIDGQLLVANPEFFLDEYHLNPAGQKLFSEQLSDLLG